jgi:hypothetical protein
MCKLEQLWPQPNYLVRAAWPNLEEQTVRGYYFYGHPPTRSPMPTSWQPFWTCVRGLMPSGCESIHLRMETDARLAFGLIVSLCVMVSHPSSACVPGPIPVTHRRVQERWRAIGSRLQASFDDCSKTSLMESSRAFWQHSCYCIRAALRHRPQIYDLCDG